MRRLTESTNRHIDGVPNALDVDGILCASCVGWYEEVVAVWNRDWLRSPFGRTLATAWSCA